MQVEQVANTKKVVKGGKKTTKIEQPEKTEQPVSEVTPVVVDKPKKTKKTKKDDTPTVETTVSQTEEVESEPVVLESVGTEPLESEPVESEPVESDPVESESDSIELKPDVFNNFYDKFVQATGLLNESFGVLKQIPSLNKDQRKKIVKARKDFAKIYDNFNSTLFDCTEKQLTTVEKGSTKAPKKRAIDKSKAAIHKPREVDLKLTEFMGLENGTLVSRAEALQAINAYVNELKKNSPEMIKVAENNKAFKVVGKLETLFSDQLQKTDDTKMPDVIKYTDIMKYMSSFFTKTT